MKNSSLNFLIQIHVHGMRTIQEVSSALPGIAVPEAQRGAVQTLKWQLQCFILTKPLKSTHLQRQKKDGDLEDPDTKISTFLFSPASKNLRTT